MATARTTTPSTPSMREIYIPRAGEQEQQTVFISVNGKNFLIPCGKKTLVPDYIAEEYERSLEAKNKFWEVSDSLRQTGN